MFPHYLINGTIFEKKNIIEHKTCFIFSTFLSETFLIPRRIQRDMITMHIGLHVKYPLFLSWFNETLLFSTFLRNTKIKFHENPSIWSRVVPCEWTDGRTDMTEPIVAFNSFANAPKNHDGICIYKFASYVSKYKCFYLECVQSGQECVCAMFKLWDVSVRGYDFVIIFR